jgi:hypothetical protein
MKQSVIDDALKTHYGNWVDNCYRYLLELAFRKDKHLVKDNHSIKDAPFKKYWEEGISPVDAAEMILTEWYPK